MAREKVDECVVIKDLVYSLKELIEKIIEGKTNIFTIGEDDSYNRLSPIDDVEDFIDVGCLQCPHCLDLTYLWKSFDCFLSKLLPIREKYYKIHEDFDKLAHIEENLPTVEEYVYLQREKYNKRKFNKNRFDKLIKILANNEIDVEKLDLICKETLDLKQKLYEAIRALHHEFILSKKTDQMDTVLDQMVPMLREQVFNWEDVNLDHECKIVYFDQNIIDKYDEDSNFKSHVDLLKNNKKYIFVYSPYNIEEALKCKNKEWQNLYFAIIRKLTDNHILLKIDGNIKVKKEDPIYSVQRASVLKEGTDAAEKLNLIQDEENRLLFPDFFSKQHIIKINSNLDSFLKWQDASQVNVIPFNIDKAMTDSFRGLNDCDEICKDDHENYIYNFNKYLNLVGYKRDKKAKTIKSNYYDVEHIIYARICDIFVTKDKKLRERAKLIYKRLGIKTKVCDEEDFMSYTK